MTFKPLTELQVKSVVQLQEGIFSDGWNEQMLLDGLKSNNLFGFTAYQNQTLIGFITFSKTEEFSDLFDILVSPSFRGQGVGKALMQKYLETIKAEGVKRSILEVRESNLSAVAFYNKLGYIKVSVRKGYYSNGENALILGRDLL